MEHSDRAIGSIGRLYRSVAILALNTLMIVFCLELLSVTARDARTALTPPQQGYGDPRENSSYYKDKTWADQYWKEFAIVRKQDYHAFTVWRRAPFKGELINIDDKGIRLTPGSDCSRGAYKVFTFGSSHMWGTGAPDWGTIPAYVRKGLTHDKSRPICVMNFAESAYVSTQSVIELMLQLQAGNRPDLALFFDGTSDIYTGYQSGMIGVHSNFELTAARVERRDLPQDSLPLQLLESSSLFQLVSGQVERLSARSRPTPSLVTYETMHVDRTVLANGIARTYLVNYATVAALAERNGFEFYFFWPPHVSSGQKALTSEELRAKDALDPALRRLHDSVYQAIEMRQHDYPNLLSITNVFDECETHVWLDETHTTPEGNQMIAQRMLQLISSRHASN